MLATIFLLWLIAVILPVLAGWRWNATRLVRPARLRLIQGGKDAAEERGEGLEVSFHNEPTTFAGAQDHA